MNIEKEFKRDFFISANESNPEGELAVNILVSNIIEVATAHANSLGIGNPSMEHLGAGWVLSRLTVEMQYYPPVNTSYSIVTWVESWNRHFSVRDFEILDSEGRTCGFARSIWMVLNTVTHENFGLGHLNLESRMISARPCPIERQLKHIEILKEEDETRKNVLVANIPVEEYTFKYNDIDYYRHVNTVRYVTLLLNSFSLKDFDMMFLKRLELSFLHEGSFGESVDILRHDEPERQSGWNSSFSLLSHTKKIPILFARTILSPRALPFLNR